MGVEIDMLHTQRRRKDNKISLTDAIKGRAEQRRRKDNKDNNIAKEQLLYIFKSSVAISQMRGICELIRTARRS